VLANFFARTSAAAAQVLQGYDDTAFRKRLGRCFVALALDSNAASTSEGMATLDMAVDLLARFYPGLSFIDLSERDACNAVIKRLKAAAKAINNRIDVDVPIRKALCCLVVGRSKPDLTVPMFFAGSHGWTARLEMEEPVGSADTANPFGASVAACLGVANLFRMIFADQLQNGLPDKSVELDVLHCRRGSSDAPPLLPETINLGEAHLIGLGAIGRSTAWTLSRVPGLAGALHLVDHETIELSNLQRYVGARQVDCGRAKTPLSASLFSQPTLVVVPHQRRWGDYLRERGHADLPLVAVALDTARDRMAVQASLPRRLLNAWTQPGDLGVSRHGFPQGPCLMCLYLPDKKVPNESELVAEALGLPELDVRAMLYLGTAVTRPLASQIATAKQVPLDELTQFIGLPLRTFYTKAVCGTALFATPAMGERGATAVPMAFQSALAGILLAAEIVNEVASLRSEAVTPVTKINLLRPLGAKLGEPSAKHISRRCICYDPIYLEAYARKYHPAPTEKGHTEL
jgi:molybdopterin/thiamine biosynthesis adenylyltransferase